MMRACVVSEGRKDSVSKDLATFSATVSLCKYSKTSTWLMSVLDRGHLTEVMLLDGRKCFRVALPYILAEELLRHIVGN